MDKFSSHHLLVTNVGVAFSKILKQAEDRPGLIEYPQIDIAGFIVQIEKTFKRDDIATLINNREFKTLQEMFIKITMLASLCYRDAFFMETRANSMEPIHATREA